MICVIKTPSKLWLLLPVVALCACESSSSGGNGFDGGAVDPDAAPSSDSGGPDSATDAATDGATLSATLVNGSFEARVVTAADTCQGFAWCVRSFSSTPGWRQILDGVDLIQNNYQQNFAVGVVLVKASDGVQYLDMNQAGVLGGIEQVVAATSGATYVLTLDTCGWANNSVPGTIGYELYDPASSMTLASDMYTDSVGGTWTTRTLTGVAKSASIGVRIKEIAAKQAGMGLDNVKLAVKP